MAENGYSTSSQESLPLSDETSALLLNQLGSSLTDIVNGVPLDVVMNEGYPSEANATSVKEEDYTVESANMFRYAITQFNLTPQFSNVNIPQDQKKAPSSLPAIENWPGNFNFTVSFSSQENVKGVQWLFCMVKNKLYVGKNVPCPVKFSTNTPMTDGVVIRAMALFSSADHASQIVHRCINHSMEEINKEVPHAEHLVRCESLAAEYVNDPITGRHSVVVPYENPPAGQNFSSYIFKFMCFGSCSGGPNRRPLVLVFSLEKGREVIGRQKIDLKICACPARDFKIDSNLQNHDVSIKTEKRKKELETPAKQSPLKVSRTMAPYNRPASEKKEPYIIKVYDHKCYTFLKSMEKYYKMLSILKRQETSSELKAFICSYLSSEEEKS